MWSGLAEAIAQAASSKIREFERYRKRVSDENQRRTRRSSGTPQRVTASPQALWQLDPALNPYHVRPRADVIAHSITTKLRAGRYTPLPPGGFAIAKPTGGGRVITNFAIADEVVSSRLYKSLLSKNRARLSARSYAYRDDVSVYDALAHMQSEWRQEHRVFVAEYDFSEFFESISHEHIWQTVDALNLTMTSLERDLVRAFLTAPLPYTTEVERNRGMLARDRGVPLGTSVSLFLANVAVSPLDRALERLGVGFVRYADDTVIWSRDYSSICRAVEELHYASTRIGSAVNQDKSMGVRLLVTPETTRAEMSSTRDVSYLSHSVGLRSVSIKPAMEDKIRRRIGALLL